MTKSLTIAALILSTIFLNGCAKGDPGATGATGQPGADAQPCVVTSVGVSATAPNGGSLISCPTSSSLVLNGTNGVAGTPGTVLTSVQLCPGTTVYPSKFIEVAFCLNNELFAVYSANGGFMTKIPAGTYGSKGINASCNFVIGSNCTIGN